MPCVWSGQGIFPLFFSIECKCDFEHKKFSKFDYSIVTA